MMKQSKYELTLRFIFYESSGQVLFDADNIPFLEKSIDAHTANLPPLKNFILPGGGPAASALQVSHFFYECWFPLRMLPITGVFSRFPSSTYRM